MRFRRDLPALKAAFAAMGPDGWKSLVEGTKGKHAALAAKAWPLFISEYFPEEQEAGIGAAAAQRYLDWHKAGKLPEWVQDLGLYGEMLAAAKGGTE